MSKNALKNLSERYKWYAIFSTTTDEHNLVEEWWSIVEELIEEYVPEDEE